MTEKNNTDEQEKIAYETDSDDTNEEDKEDKEEKPEDKKSVKIRFIKYILVIFVYAFILFLILLHAIDAIYIKYYSDKTCVDKPVIYVYAEHDETDVTVKLGDIEKLTCTYPEYDDELGWETVADKSGKLSMSGKDYYCLYWEGENTDFDINKGDAGYCIAGKDTSKFLDEKLELLGLNYKERQEFIIYWLPKMQENAYNLIKFESREAVDNYMSLDVIADGEQVDSNIIRVYMTFKGVDEFTEMKEQELRPATRNSDALTVVEWGGTEIK